MWFHLPVLQCSNYALIVNPFFVVWTHFFFGFFPQTFQINQILWGREWGRKTWQKIVSKAILFPLEQQTILSALILSSLLEFALISEAAELCQRGSQKRDLPNQLAERENWGKTTFLTRAGAFSWEGWGEHRGSIPAEEPGLRMQGGSKRLSASPPTSPTRETTASDLDAVKWRSIANNWAN